jgi:MSHA biogenesis protein MshN
MSLVNQVLSDLERRGVKGGTAGMPIRPVNVDDQRRYIIPALIAALLLAGLAGLWAALQHKSVPSPIAASPAIQPENSGQSSIGGNPAAQEGSIHDTLNPAPVRKLQVDDGRHPGMRMSLELNTVAPISSPRRMPELQATTEQVPAPAQVENKDGTPMIFKSGKQAPDAATEPTGSSSAHAGTPVVQQEIAATGIDKKVRQVTLQQQAEIEFRKANGLMQQGRIDEAIAGYKSSLQLDAGYQAARQAMVGLLLEGKRNNEAEQVLQEGLAIDPRNFGFAMVLARLQVERSALPQALETLQKTLPYAEQQADYQAFIAAVLQRLNRHKDAIEHYQIALRLSPNSGVWLMGLGISLQAEKHNDAALIAFRQAIDSHTLNGDLQAFVNQRLRELNP